MPIFQYAADDRSWNAEQQRKTNKERQLAAGNAASAEAAANPTGKPKLDLLKVPKDPESESVFGDLRGLLKRDVSEQSKQLSALDAIRKENNAKMSSAVNEDVLKIGDTAKKYAEDTRAATSNYDRLINEGKDLSLQMAAGGLERARMSKNPYLGWSTSNTYDAAQAVAPIYNQAAQRGQEINQAALDRILAADRGTIGQREGILSGWDAFQRGQLDDRQRLTAGNLANAGAFSRLYNDSNFLGVGGPTNNAPYSLPSALSNFRVPAYYPPTASANRGPLSAVVGGGIGAATKAPTAPANARELYRQWTGFYPEDKRHSFDRDMYEMLGGEVRDTAPVETVSDFSASYADSDRGFEGAPGQAGLTGSAGGPYRPAYSNGGWDDATQARISAARATQQKQHALFDANKALWNQAVDSGVAQMDWEDAQLVPYVNQEDVRRRELAAIPNPWARPDNSRNSYARSGGPLFRTLPDSFSDIERGGKPSHFSSENIKRFSDLSRELAQLSDEEQMNFSAALRNWNGRADELFYSRPAGGWRSGYGAGYPSATGEDYSFREMAEPIYPVARGEDYDLRPVSLPARYSAAQDLDNLPPFDSSGLLPREELGVLSATEEGY